MRDRYGHYKCLSGHEAPGMCWWCGAEGKRNRRYCCEQHRDLYWETFNWGCARVACIARQDGKCTDCGGRAVEVHHITPLPDASPSTRAWNVLNRPENLVALCTKCHGRRHTKPKLTRVEQLVEHGQLPLPLGV